MTRDDLLEKITRFYLESPDFNGLPLRDFFGADYAQIQELLKDLIRDEMIAIVYGDGHPNPHIRALPEHHTAEEQIALLTSSPFIKRACAYPLPKHLERVVDRSNYAEKPYTLELALGGPQLSHRAFDMMILETYRNDPRYHYECDGIKGYISITDEYYESDSIDESDQVLLNEFGFSYTEDFKQYVAVFLYDLAGLSPEHQKLWKIREFSGTTRLHPDYFRTSIMGEWYERGSIYDAFIEEIRIINEMSKAMNRPALFSESYEQRPKEFGPLLRPTTRELNSFIHLLDKMISENINKAFFQNDIPSSEEVTRPDGKIEVRQIGSITMLDNWLHTKWRFQDDSPAKKMIKTFRDIRKRRQKPAHSVLNDTFSQKNIQDQRDLIESVYESIVTGASPPRHVPLSTVWLPRRAGASRIL